MEIGYTAAEAQGSTLGNRNFRAKPTQRAVKGNRRHDQLGRRRSHTVP